MNLDTIFENVAAAIPSWLEYQVACGREMLLSEGYLAQPVGEVLRFEHPGTVKVEYNHPIITSPGRGRPRQVDYVLTGVQSDVLVAGLEVKWVDASIPSKQRIVDDLLRLECLKHAPGHPQSAGRYFLVAGSKSNINEKFLGLTSNGGGSRVPFLPCFLDSSDPSWKNIGVQDLPSWLGKYFCSFEDSYGTEIPKVFRTRLVRAAHSDGFSAMLWRVDSGVGQRSTFRAKEYWPAVSVPLVEGDDE